MSTHLLFGEGKDGSHQTKTLWMWTFARRQFLTCPNLWWFYFTAWKDHPTAITRKLLPIGRNSSAVTLPFHISEVAVAL
jgi:hypothetical protein